MRSWSFLKDFKWAAPPPITPTWSDALRLINAARERQAQDLVQLRDWLNVRDAQLRDLGGDPLREDWAAFRPLRLSREEDWSDWLAYLIGTSSTGVFWSATLSDKRPSRTFANPRVVKREWPLPDGYRADLGIELQDGAWIHLEVKIGDDDLKKTIGTGQAMRTEVGSATVDDLLLLPAEDKPLWDTVIEDVAKTHDQAEMTQSVARAVRVIDWNDVSRGLRSALCEAGETLGWRVFARAFCGAVEQTLIGLPRIPSEAALDSLSLLDLERLIRYCTAPAPAKRESDQ